MSQQGQVFAQRSTGADGTPLWGYLPGGGCDDIAVIAGPTRPQHSITRHRARPCNGFCEISPYL